MLAGRSPRRISKRWCTGSTQKNDPESNLFVFARFFAVDSKEEAEQFMIDHGSTDLGKELILMYNQAVADVNNLYTIENSPYFQGRLSEAEVEERIQKAEERTKAKTKQEAQMTTARNLLKKNYPYEVIYDATGLTEAQVKALC